jgi:hypothetical protein
VFAWAGAWVGVTLLRTVWVGATCHSTRTGHCSPHAVGPCSCPARNVYFKPASRFKRARKYSLDYICRHGIMLPTDVVKWRCCCA